ncbi:DEAD/DEAH box helicase [Wohlfahrtiimonas chitiniclastica]|uniref:DEAD/DEAH box helicase n=1 Tax=Wohlfahrtiimonas chitiniclastica TaxID=400946 RepID=UPI00036225A5|nr:nuclease-related domain-containing DEAD/DEAH box helicase [Wohlfahrtiimonas chitiniclastica]
MAFIIPTIKSSEGSMTAGENRFARRLQDKLDDDTVCWFNIPIHGYYPDFVLFHPQRGLLVLEVKDWKIDNIEIFSRLHVALRNVPEVLKENPLEQAKRSRREIVKQLGAGFLAQHRIAYGEGVVLTNITRKMYREARFDEVLPGHLVICSDEMYESVPPEQFSAQLWGMLPFQMQTTLNDDLIQRIRGTLYPEICIPLKQAELFSHEIVEAQAPESMGILKVMDLQQEQLARSLGIGHRIIHGVAGSGKTVILKYRAEYLAKSATQPILVVCYNKSLAQDLTLYFEHKNLSDKVHVYSFHAWCSAQLKAHGCQKPPKENNIDLYCQSLVTTVLNHLENKSLPRQQYAAVLIDEGHDFEADWYKIMVQMLDHTETLLILYDDAQSIYGVDQKKIKTFSSVGINARGRTTILRTNYRNPCTVLDFAKRFSDNYIAHEGDEDAVPLLEPKSAGRIGVKPLVMRIQNNDYQKEAHYIVEAMVNEHKNGRPWQDMAVIHRYTFFSDAIRKVCYFKSVPIATEENRMQGVRFITMHASKGLEFPFVCIPSVGRPYRYNGELSDEAKLLYVAITRSTDKLLVTYHDDSIFCPKLLEAAVSSES